MKYAAVTLSLFLLLAPAAYADAANDHGEGWYGETNDLTITLAGFVLIAGFPLFILLASLALWRLEKRKDARKAADKARMKHVPLRGGW